MKNHNDIIRLNGKIYTRQALKWHVLFWWLDDIREYAYSDEGFRKRFEELYSYVCDKIEMPIDGDITDAYVLLEQRDGSRTGFESCTAKK